MNDGMMFISVRLSKELVRKLDQVALKTHRTRSHLLRLLISHAEILARPDLMPVPTDQVAGKEAGE